MGTPPWVYPHQENEGMGWSMISTILPFAKYVCIHCICFSQEPFRIGDGFLPILQMKKLRLKQ